MIRISFLVLGLLLFSSVSEAALLPNVGGDRASTLPQHRSMATWIRLWSSIDSRYTTGGKTEPVSSNFSQNIKWKTIVSEAGIRRQQLGGLLSSSSAIRNLDDSAGSYSANFAGDLKADVFVLGHGITDTIGAFLVVPVIKFHAEARVAYQASDSARGLVSSFHERGEHTAGNTFAQALNNGFETRLAELGYRFEPVTDVSSIGDCRLEIPIVPDVVQRSKGWKHGARASVLIPTGKRADPNDLYQFKTGDGRWGAGGRLISSYYWKRFTVSVTGGALVPFATQQVRRIPKHEDDLLPEETETVRVSQGLEYDASIIPRFSVSRVVTFQAGLQHQRRLKTQYRGQRFTTERYSVLDRESGEMLNSMQFAIELNSIQPFLEGKFVMPGQVLAGFGLPISGQNTLAEPVFSVQTSLFF